MRNRALLSLFSICTLMLLNCTGCADFDACEELTNMNFEARKTDKTLPFKHVHKSLIKSKQQKKEWVNFFSRVKELNGKPLSHEFYSMSASGLSMHFNQMDRSQVVAYCRVTYEKTSGDEIIVYEDNPFFKKYKLIGAMVISNKINQSEGSPMSIGLDSVDFESHLTNLAENKVDRLKGDWECKGHTNTFTFKDSGKGLMDSTPMTYVTRGDSLWVFSDSLKDPIGIHIHFENSQTWNFHSEYFSGNKQRIFTKPEVPEF